MATQQTISRPARAIGIGTAGGRAVVEQGGTVVRPIAVVVAVLLEVSARHLTIGRAARGFQEPSE
jgi:hypothetical protein